MTIGPDLELSTNFSYLFTAVAMCCLFMIAMICGILPFKLAQIFKWNEPSDENSERRDTKASLTVSCLLSFGGGCLLATTFLHLLPEISEEIKILQNNGKMPKFFDHLAELLMCVGFFVIYLVEELVHAYLHRHQNSKKKKSIEHKKSQMSLAPELIDQHINHHLELDADELGVAFERGLHARSSSIINRYSSIRGDVSDSIEALPTANGSISTSDLIKNEIHLEEKQQKQISTIDLKPEILNNNHYHSHSHENHNNHSHGHSHIPITHSDDEDFLVSSLRGLLIVLALSVHELFEGLAVGLESSSGNVYYMFAAVSVHKFVIAFCIGVELMVSQSLDEKNRF